METSEQNDYHWSEVGCVPIIHSMELPETQYADSHGLSIAYQVMGEGPIDLVVVPGVFSHVELFHEIPGYTRYLRRLSEFARVITFDKRGQGLSSALEGIPSLEERVEDLLSVMDACGSQEAALFGISEGAAMAFFAAATHPNRISHIISFGGYLKAHGTPDYPHMPDETVRRERLMKWADDWGRGGGIGLTALMPELKDDETMRRVFARIERFCSSPQAIRKYFDVLLKVDALGTLPLVQAPSLILQREDDLQVPPAAAKNLAESISNSRYVNAGTGGHFFCNGAVGPSIEAVREFLTGAKSKKVSESRVLAAVLFSDIVGSTERLNELGDEAWRDLLDQHDNVSRELIMLHRGKFVKSTGDGVVAIFDGPGRCVECALQLSDRLAGIGIPVRMGIHTGEVELRGEDISGAGVHVAARIEGLAGANDVYVSRTVVDLMAGNLDVAFSHIGRHSLKGVPGEWEVFKAT